MTISQHESATGNEQLWSAMAQLVERKIGDPRVAMLVRDSPEPLYCVLEQDTLSAAQFWFNPRRQEIVPT